LCEQGQERFERARSYDMSTMPREISHGPYSEKVADV
jgi:hypothetical protein